jgi:hypothetical protein
MINFVKNFLTKRKGSKIYDEKLKEFLSDGKIDDNEKKQLKKIANEYSLLEEDLMEAHKKACSLTFNDITSDGKITEEEKKALQELMNYFKIEQKDFNFNQKTFNKFYTIGLIEKGILPEISVPDLNIIFKKGEVIHWCCPASLRKIKRITNRISYKGFTGSVKIGLGIRYRAGSLGYSTQSSEFLATEDTGVLWLTNQRVGFKGDRKNFAFPYTKIHSFEVSSTALSISKEGKETPILVSLDDYDVPCMVISSILNKQE